MNCRLRTDKFLGHLSLNAFEFVYIQPPKSFEFLALKSNYFPSLSPRGNPQTFFFLYNLVIIDCPFHILYIGAENKPIG
jgi:hypothetical protein